MRAQSAHPQVHEGVRRDRKRNAGITAHASAQAAVGHRCHHEVKPSPWVFTAVLNQDLKQGTTGEVDHAVTDLVDQWCDGQGHARLHAHTPQALLPVTQGLVDEFNVSHFAFSLGKGLRNYREPYLSDA